MTQLTYMERPTSEQMAEIQAKQAESQRYSQLAQQLMASGQRDHNSWGDVAATLVNAWSATKMQKKADESAKEYTRRMLEAQRQQEAMQKQQEAEKAKAEREAKFEDFTRREQWKLDHTAEEQTAGIDPDMIKLENSARGEYSKTKGAFQDQVINHQKLETALKSNSGAGDYAAVISFVKSLDPTSVVREGEAAMASDVAGLYDKLRMLGQQVKEGERLSPAVKAQYLNLSKQWLAQVAETQRQRQDDAIYRANRYGYDQRSVIGNPTDFDAYLNPQQVGAEYFAPVEQNAPQQGPQPGAVMDGYVFMGGNPADQNNWRKQ